MFPDRAPLPGDSLFPPRLGLLLRLLGLRFFNPPFPQVGAQLQAFRLSLFFWHILARSLGFCIASDFDYLLIYHDSLINFFAPFPVSLISISWFSSCEVLLERLRSTN